MKSLSSRINHKLRVWKHAFSGHQEDKSTLGLQANHFWNDFSREERAQEAHWRGHGPFADDAVWLALGGEHQALVHRILRAAGQSRQHHHVVEWGCGGGMNAVHFARGAEKFWGVDIARTSLDECARQMKLEGLPGFVPVLVDANQPQTALAQIGQRCDLFICTYLMEVLPTEAHALELVGLAHQLLAPGGHALFHIRSSDGALASRSRPWDYALNMAHNVSFKVDDFSAACRARGFTVLGMEKKAYVPELNESNYAYFVLQA